MTDIRKIFVTILFIALVACAPVSDTPDLLYRGDTRTPEQVKEAGGFDSWAKSNGKTADYDVARHASRYHTKHGVPAPDGGFVSTTTNLEVAISLVAKNGRNGYIYHIKGVKDAVDVNKHLAAGSDFNNFKTEQEHAIKDHIPWDKVWAWQEMKKGKVRKVVRNPDFRTEQDDAITDRIPLNKGSAWRKLKAKWGQSP